MGTVLIKNGTIVTASDVVEADVFVADEKVQAIGRGLTQTADKTIDAKGCYLFPGGIDAHTHMDLPFMGTSSSDDFETGTLAGLYGGTTTIIDFAFQKQGGTLMEALGIWHEKAKGKAVGDYAFHVAVTDFNEKVRGEIKTLIEKEGVTSFKTFMAYKGALMIDDRQMIALMQETAKHGGLVTVHAENGDLVDSLVQANVAAGNFSPRYHALSHPEITEAEATGRAIDIAYSGGHPVYIVHLTCEGALNRVRDATTRNQKVLVETCVQYLLLDDSLYENGGLPPGSPGSRFEGAKWVMSPPLRKKKDQEALWSGIGQGLVHTVATDHCPFCMDQKKMGEQNFAKIPNGAPGVENRMELMYSEGVAKGRLSLNKFVEITATAPAKIFGLYPRKGTIAVGGDADIVVFDPKVEHTLSAKTQHMRCDYSAYEGWKVTGKTRSVLLRGTLAIENGKANVGKGFGKYLPRAKFNPHESA